MLYCLQTLPTSVSSFCMFGLSVNMWKKIGERVKYAAVETAFRPSFHRSPQTAIATSTLVFSRLNDVSSLLPFSKLAQMVDRLVNLTKVLGHVRINKGTRPCENKQRY